jgi:hypothetical protein
VISEMTGKEPRAVTPEELRVHFLDTCRALAGYWASDAVKNATCHERLSGLVHSILCIFDGVNGGLPAFDIVAQPHPDDKEYHRSEGENWIEPGTVINDCMLHELLYRPDLPGAWHKHQSERNEPQ